MSAASLGPAAATDILNALLGIAALPGMVNSVDLALTVGSADPAGPPVELSYTGYARQAVTFDNRSGAGSLANAVAASWSVPTGTVVGGVSLLTAHYTTLASPLGWFDLAGPITIAEVLALVIPTGTIVLDALTTP